MLRTVVWNVGTGTTFFFFALREAEKIAEQAVIKEHGMDTAGLKMEEQQPETGELTKELMKES